MHKIFGKKEDVEYTTRIGAYFIPIEDNKIGVIQTPKGYFLNRMYSQMQNWAIKQCIKGLE